jgi:hypothetical protein
MEPVNHWQPVTSQYQHELPRFIHQPSPRRQWITPARAGRALGRSEPELSTGVACVSWFYILAAGFYFIFGSVLLSAPSSNFAALLINYFRIVIPLPIGVADGIPLDSLLAEAFFLLAMVSASVGVMWLVRFRPVRWITLGYAGAALVRSAYYFLDDRGAPATALTSSQIAIWLVVSLLDALVFCFVAYSSSVERAFEGS